MSENASALLGWQNTKISYDRAKRLWPPSDLGLYYILASLFGNQTIGRALVDAGGSVSNFGTIDYW